MKVRSDAWSHEDDLLLAETVLRYVREGGTQLQAFEEVGDKLNRTSAACGFRWNAEVRKQYEQAMQIAKKQRKERKRALANSASVTASSQPKKSPTPSKGYSPSYKEEVSEELTTRVDTSSHPTKKNLSIDDVISFLTSLKHEGTAGSEAKQENERLRRENEDLRKKSEELERKVKHLSSQHETIQEDYQALVQIMDRARRMVMFDDTEERQSPVFKMDKNGNLERVAK
ncbi:RsfA family transcriptional regulator [Bacillus salitolerans]|uniref:RsfA family transcriptional regulator n=1 Tax=Bacillus salitolerans TaxID=1437434 RepID=A0ABW4LNE9_9BACI